MTIAGSSGLARPPSYDDVCSLLRSEPRRFLVTGVAGFIGSHLLEALLGLGQSVSIARARNELSYVPSHDLLRGLSETIAWYAPRVLRSAERTVSHGTTRASEACVQS